nr:uncharacterized protein LOC118968056 [Manis javanica]XP_036852582.1 uncharacterized protein LOC118968056 [Manis javanica]
MGSIFVSLFHFISFLFCSAQGYKRGGGKSSYFLSTAGLSPHRQRAPERRNLDTSGRERSRKSTQALHFSLNHSAESLFVLGQLRSNPGEASPHPPPGRAQNEWGLLPGVRGDDTNPGLPERSAATRTALSVLTAPLQRLHPSRTPTVRNRSGRQEYSGLGVDPPGEEGNRPTHHGRDLVLVTEACGVTSTQGFLAPIPATSLPYHPEPEPQRFKKSRAW